MRPMKSALRIRVPPVEVVEGSDEAGEAPDPLARAVSLARPPLGQ
jgi:hypothetical protein